VTSAAGGRWTATPLTARANLDVRNGCHSPKTSPLSIRDPYCGSPSSRMWRWVGGRVVSERRISANDSDVWDTAGVRGTHVWLSGSRRSSGDVGHPPVARPARGELGDCRGNVACSSARNWRTAAGRQCLHDHDIDFVVADRRPRKRGNTFPFVMRVLEGREVATGGTPGRHGEIGARPRPARGKSIRARDLGAELQVAGPAAALTAAGDGENAKHGSEQNGDTRGRVTHDASRGVGVPMSVRVFPVERVECR